MTLTKKQINLIIKQTPERLRKTREDLFPVLGTFTDAAANWSYVDGWTKEGLLAVTVCGIIV